MRNKILEEKYKILLLIIIFSILSLLTYFIHFILEVDIIYTHLLYFPTILACFWWKKKGLVLTFFMVGFLIFFPVFFRPNVINIENILRMLIIISIGLFIVFLSEKISNVTYNLLENEKKLKKLNMELEQKVNERTKELKKSNELLKKSREQLNLIFSNLKDPIFVISEDYKILFKNENAHKIFGEKLAGRNCYEIIKGLDHPCEHCPIKTFKDKDICEVRFDQCINTPLIDGTRIFDIVTSKIENYGGVSAIVEVFRDITERKKAEEELRKAKFFSESILDSLPGVFYFFDENGKFLRWNKNFEVVSEYSAGEISKMNILDFFTGDDKRHISERIQEVFVKGKSTAEADFISKSSKKIPHYFTGLRVIIDNIPYLGGMGIDITERKKAEKELEEYSDKLEGMVEQRTKELRDAQEELVRKEKLAIIGKLASGIGHELRNPIGVISNSIYYLNMKIKDPDVKVSKHLNIIQKEVERSNIIITDLLDFARTRPPSLEEVDICSIIKETLDNIKLPENIILEKNLDAELPRIQLDPYQIQRAFQNIILNAIQAMLEGGKLEIKTLTRGNLFEIIFKDTGVGISKDNLEKIFEPLFTTKAKGIGLGLSIVKDIVEKHKGKIEVESEVDVGTTLIIKLPFLMKEGI